MLAGITDILDGYIARKYNMISKTGKILDPLADKFMQLTVIICLAYVKIVPPWAIIIIIVKEILMIIGGILLYKDKIVVAANWYGKVATTLFYVSILVIILFEQKLTKVQVSSIIGIALISTIFAFIKYTVNYKKIKHKRLIVKDNN